MRGTRSLGPSLSLPDQEAGGKQAAEPPIQQVCKEAINVHTTASTLHLTPYRGLRGSSPACDSELRSVSENEGDVS